MALFRRKQDPDLLPPPAPPRSTPNRSASASSTAQDQSATGGTDWSDIANIRNEWPQSQLDVDTDLGKWREGIALYENDDYLSMMKCANLLSSALAHSLYGDGIVQGDDFPDTIFKALYASLEPPPDGRSFPDGPQRCARLALTLVRENGWSPASMGGSGLFDKLIMDKGNYMLLMMAVSPGGRPFEGDLKAFFAVPPQPVVPHLPNPETEDGNEVVSRMYETMQKAESGDEASEHHFQGMAYWSGGRNEEALVELAEAAKLGSVQAMKDAGDLTSEMGRPEESRFWYESAAHAGNPAAMWNMAVLANDARDLASAADWYQQSAEAGLADGYAALTQLASDRDDSSAERHWSMLGAEAGQTFCMGRHGLLLLMDAEGDVPTMRRARDFLEQAANRGSVDAMGLAVTVNFQLGDQPRGRRYIQMVVDTGDTDKIDMLRRHGFL
jgi:hypothetical protein